VWADETFRHVVENLIWEPLTQILTRIVRHRARVLGLDLPFLCVDRVILDGQACFLVSRDVFLARGRDIIVVDDHGVSRLTVAHDGLNSAVRFDQLCPVRRVEDRVGREEGRAGEYAGVEEDII